MRSNATRAAELAIWGTQHQIAPGALDQIRRSLETGQRELDLSVIAVRDVPPFLRAERMLDSVTLRFTAEEQIHVDVARLPRLRTLRIVGNEMHSLLLTGRDKLQVQRHTGCALEVVGGERLHEIKLHSGAFDRLHVSDMPQLRLLDVSDSLLQYLTVLQAPQLERLDASMNPLLDEGLELGTVDRLASISLAMGRLSCVPPALRELTALRDLDLQGNQISIVTPADLPGPLVSLNLSGNWLSVAPLDCAFRATLRDLRLEMNRIVCVSNAIGSFMRLETLDLSHNRILVLPAATGRCHLLRVLKLSSNRLSWLPPEIGELASLETLHLDDNALVALPDEMHRLTRLTSLQLQRNGLSSLPDRLDEVPLRRLNLNANPFYFMPEPLLRSHTSTGQPSLEALAALDLGNTRLLEVPTGLGHRCALVQLSLRGNPQLNKLPADFSNLRRLRWLDLVGCGFRRFPSVLERMSRRTDVLVYRNPLDQRVRLELGRRGDAGGRGAWVTLGEARTIAPLTDEVRAWRAQLGKALTAKVEARWNACLPFKSSHTFARLLGGLRELPEFVQSSSAGHTRFWFAVNRLLVDIEENPELCGYIFEEAELNSAMLADRHRLSFDRLTLTARLHALAKGTVADGLVAALLMRESFRRECVAVIAARQAAASRADAEVALDLAYRINLAREPEGFSFGYDAQLDTLCARFPATCLSEVLANIRHIEERELVRYMIESPAWRRYLMRSRADAYLTLIADFDAGLEACPPEDVTGEVRRAPDRDIVLAQREAAVLAWLQHETIALVTDNPLLLNS